MAFSALSQFLSKIKYLSSILTGNLCVLFLLLSSQTAFAAGDLQPVSFLDSPDPVAARGLVTYEINVHNNSINTADNPNFELALPAGFRFVSDNGNGHCSYNGTDPSGGLATDIISCNWLTMPANASHLLEVVLRTSDVIGTYPITATTDCTDDENPANNSESNNTEVVKSADLVLTKTSDPEVEVVAGGILAYNFLVENNGPYEAVNLTITDELPGELTFYEDDDTDNWDCSAIGHDVTCTTASLANGATDNLSFRVRVTGYTTGGISNSASVSAETLDSDLTNNTSTDAVNILEGTDVAIVKTVGTNPVIGGVPATFTLTITNRGAINSSKRCGY